MIRTMTEDTNGNFHNVNCRDLRTMLNMTVTDFNFVFNGCGTVIVDGEEYIPATDIKRALLIK